MKQTGPAVPAELACTVGAPTAGERLVFAPSYQKPLQISRCGVHRVPFCTRNRPKNHGENAFPVLILPEIGRFHKTPGSSRTRIALRAGGTVSSIGAAMN